MSAGASDAAARGTAEEIGYRLWRADGRGQADPLRWLRESCIEAFQ